MPSLIGGGKDGKCGGGAKSDWREKGWKVCGGGAKSDWRGKDGRGGLKLTIYDLLCPESF